MLAQLDELGTCSEHWKILITAGMGFFADAYDLFVIGVAAALITTDWHVAGYQKSLLSSVALLASAVGAIVFGRLADKLGRRTVYGFEVLVLSAGAIASACSSRSRSCPSPRASAWKNSPKGQPRPGRERRLTRSG